MKYKEFCEMTPLQIASKILEAAKLHKNHDEDLIWTSYTSSLRGPDTEGHNRYVKHLFQGFLRGSAKDMVNILCFRKYIIKIIENPKDLKDFIKSLTLKKSRPSNHYLSHSFSGLQYVTLLLGEVSEVANYLSDIAMAILYQENTLSLENRILPNVHAISKIISP